MDLKFHDHIRSIVRKAGGPAQNFLARAQVAVSATFALLGVGLKSSHLLTQKLRGIDSCGKKHSFALSEYIRIVFVFAFHYIRHIRRKRRLFRVSSQTMGIRVKVYT